MQPNDTITISAFDASGIVGLANSLNGSVAMEEFGLFLSDTSDTQQKGSATCELVKFFAHVHYLVRQVNTILQPQGKE